MDLGKYLKVENIFIRDRFDDTDAFYTEFAEFLKDRELISDQEKVKRLFIKRENVQSTAVGRGLAAPHIFCDEFSEVVISIALIKEGMEFKSPDGEKVFVVFLLMSDDRDVGLHLKTLAHIARLERSTPITESIKKAVSAEEIVEVTKELEKLI